MADCTSREAISISLVFAHSGLVDAETIFAPSQAVVHDFFSLCHAIGWPVLLQDHVGFKGALRADFCTSAPYYADESCEVIFNVPYFLHDTLQMHQLQRSLQDLPDVPASATSSAEETPLKRPKSGRVHHNKANTLRETRSAKAAPADPLLSLKTKSSSHTLDRLGLVTHENADEEEVEVEGYASSGARTPSSSATVPAAHQLRLTELFQSVSKQDRIIVIWIQEMDQWETIPRKLFAYSNAQIFMFIHPLPSSPGLFTVRYLIASGALEDHLSFGPLVEGMVVSQEALGTLLTQTVISAHLQCKHVKEAWHRSPWWHRRQSMDDLAHRYMANPSFTEYYASLFQ